MHVKRAEDLVQERHEVEEGEVYTFQGVTVFVRYTYFNKYQTNCMWKPRALVECPLKKMFMDVPVCHLSYIPPNAAMKLLKEVNSCRELGSLSSAALKFMFAHDIPLLKRFLAGYFMTDHLLPHKAALKAAEWVAAQLEKKEDEEPAA